MKAIETHSALNLETQAGFSLMELIIAGVLMTGMLVASGVFNFSGDESKATNLLTVAKELGSGAQRYNAHTSVNPMHPISLFDNSKNTAADTFEGIAASNTWRGPYVNGFTAATTPAGAYTLDAFVQGATADFARITTNLPAGATSGYQVVLDGLPEEVGKRIVSNCNGAAATATMPTTHADGARCIGTVTDGVATVSYLYTSK